MGSHLLYLFCSRLRDKISKQYKTAETKPFQGFKRGDTINSTQHHFHSPFWAYQVHNNSRIVFLLLTMAGEMEAFLEPHRQ